MEANEENGCGWVVKGPFTTNSQCIKFVHSFDEMKVSMCTLSKKYFGNLPYLMIQPCMYNRKEYKVVVLTTHLYSRLQYLPVPIANQNMGLTKHSQKRKSFYNLRRQPSNDFALLPHLLSLTAYFALIFFKLLLARW